MRRLGEGTGTVTKKKAAARPKGTKAAPSPAKASAPSAVRAPSRFPVVGIGASAGGLEALELFFRNVPAASGLAFVVVQHLDPTHKGIMPELLQRITSMPVSQARDRMRVKPNAVYVIPPNSDLSILRGALYLLPPSKPRGLRLPIDFFFRSLARDQQELAVGVILSGMGSDGTLGLRAIKEVSGVALVQTPATAKFDGMPRSAVDAGVADFVVPAEELPQAIGDYLRRVPFDRTHAGSGQRSEVGIEKVVLLLQAHTGHDFSLYKRSTIHRRIERRMGIHQVDRIADYVRYLQENPLELDLLFRELLIGVSSFFRDPEAWEHLKTKAFPALFSSRAAGTTLRAWIPGCSTGEEAYSLAMTFKEALAQLKPPARYTLQVFATDLDQDAIDRARQAYFPGGIERDVSPERLERYFVPADDRYRMTKEIREMVVFAHQNLIADAPFTKLDLLLCRNLLIYFEPELQKKVLPLFHYSLNPGGVLFLGSAESVGGFSDLFSAVDAKAKIFRRVEPPVAARGELAVFPLLLGPSRPSAEKPARTAAPESFQAQAEQILLQRFTPAAVVVDGKGDILYVNGKTGKYLEPAAGKANWNIFAMAREGLRYDLTAAFRKAVRSRRPVVLRDLKVETGGGEQAVEVQVHAMGVPEALRGLVMIVFSDQGAPAPAHAGIPARGRAGRSPHVAELELALQRAGQELQSTREEMQTSQEELKSTNEELQSTNEELQSTNEEMTTSKEELQSLNEELQTVNAELQAKVTDLSRMNNDMKNLLNATDIATVFLDGALNVRRFTTQASKIVQLIPGDIGRPFSDLKSSLDYPGLEADAREVLRTLVFSEKQVDAPDGRVFRVRIMPYRTVEDMIDGVVITFTDVTGYLKNEKGNP